MEKRQNDAVDQTLTQFNQLSQAHNNQSTKSSRITGRKVKLNQSV